MKGGYCHLAGALFLLGACADGTLTGGQNTPGLSHPLSVSPAYKEAVAGMGALTAGDADTASRHFNRALKAEPDSSPLHMLNGLAYHAGSAHGARARMELAETGYLLALQFDPTNDRAAYLLGLLYLEMRRFQAAQAQLLRAVRLGGPAEPERLHALAVASYFAQDVEIALWASEQALAQSPRRPEFLEAAAVVNAAAGRSSRAETLANRYTALVPQPSRMALIRRRLSDWERVYRHLAQAPPDPPQAPGTSPFAPPSGGPPPSGAYFGAPPSGPPDPAAPGSGGSRGPLAQSWSDCVQTLTQGGGRLRQPQRIVRRIVGRVGSGLG